MACLQIAGKECNMAKQEEATLGRYDVEVSWRLIVPKLNQIHKK